MIRAPRLLVFPFVCVLCQALSAQNVTTFTVRGVLTDSIERQPLDAANVVIMKATDSVYVAGSMSDEKGVFEIGKVPAGQYKVMISYLGYQSIMRPLSLSGTPRTVHIGGINLQKQDLQISEVVVSAKFNPIIVKKDTLEFNTSAYKVQESAVVEDLLKKLPGVEVDQDGAVTSGGQQITKVFVDGKQFFGDDPKVALKNLPANIVDKVQVVDRKSDQAQFTGIEDDDTEKVINLTLRPGNRDGMFGRAMVGYGTEDRYDTNGIISYFNGDTQLAALLSTNNTNNLNFTDFMGDVMSSMGGSGRRMGGGGGGGGGNRNGGGGTRTLNVGGISLTSGGGGVSTSTSGGANVNYRFGEKLKVGANYFFNMVDRETDQFSNRVNFLADSSFIYNQTQLQDRKSQNHRINLELDYTINENNSLLFRPNVNIGAGSATSDYDYETLTPSGLALNSGMTQSNSENHSLSTSGTLLWRHKFAKVGRTFSVNLNYGYSDNKANGENFQKNNSFDAADIWVTDTVNQLYTNNNHGYNYSIRASYIEPVGNNRFLEFSYQYSRNNTKSEKQTYDYNRVTHAYDILDTVYSSRYENIYVNHQANIRFNTRRDKYSYTLGVGMQPSSLTSITWPNDDHLTQNVLNFSPTANFTYGVSRQNMLRFDYRGTTQQPSIQQLQPVADNTDPLYEQKGNPDLKPAFRHSLTATYNNFNPDNFRTFLMSLSLNTTNNSIVNSSAYDETGKQIVKPVNVNGVYNINASVTMNLPIPKTKFSFSNTLSGNYGNSINYSNELENSTRNTGVNEMLRLTYRNDWLELGGSYRLGYNRANYSLQDKATTDYFNHRLGGELFLNLPWSIILSSSINYNFYRGYGDSYNRDMTLWSADISKQLFKNKRGTIKLNIYDILKENKSYTRTTTDNYVEDVRSNILGQFVMLSFMYRFNSFGGNQQQNRSRDRMPGDGMPRRFEGGGPLLGGFPDGGMRPN
jgi:predicted secreted protein